MPRYYFSSANGHRECDIEGTELADDASAQLEAMRFAGEVLKSEPGRIWSEGQWRVEVTNEENVLLFTIITIAVDAPGLGSGNDAALDRIQ